MRASMQGTHADQPWFCEASVPPHDTRCCNREQGTLLVHALLLFWDRLPLLPVCTSAGAHLAYLQLLKRFPFFRLSSWEGISSILLLVAANVGWGRYFW